MFLRKGAWLQHLTKEHAACGYAALPSNFFDQKAPGKWNTKLHCQLCIPMVLTGDTLPGNDTNFSLVSFGSEKG